MLHAVDKLASPGNEPFMCTGVLTKLEGDSLMVRIEYNQASFVVEARNALTHSYQPTVGDEVLVNGENFRSAFIVGVLNVVGKKSVQRVSTGNGALAESREHDGHEVLSVKDKDGYLLFEYDATENKSKLYAAKGDLSLTALEGDIELISGKHIKAKSLGGIMLESATAAQLRVASDEENQSSITLSAKGMLLSSKGLGFRAEKAEINIDNSRFKGKTFNAVLDRSKLVVEKIETTANRIIEKAINVYRQVEELQQTRANRVRTMVKGSYQLSSETTYIKAEKHVNIDGEKIHLG
jgi:hypothetical protein